MKLPQSEAVSESELFQLFGRLGIGPGATVFVHSDLAVFGLGKDSTGKLSLALSPEQLYGTLMSSMDYAGTIVVPAFTYSFAKNQKFSINNSKCATGAFSEYVRKLPEARRSRHGLLSIAAIGPKAPLFTSGLDNTSFGSRSPYAIMLEQNTHLLMVGVPFCSFKDFVEVESNVPYRYPKTFEGVLENENGTLVRESAVHYVRYRTDEPVLNSFVDGLNEEERQRIARIPIGRSYVQGIAAQTAYSILTQKLQQSPYAYVKNDLRTRHLMEWICWAREYSDCEEGGEVRLVVRQVGMGEVWEWTLGNAFELSWDRVGAQGETTTVALNRKNEKGTSENCTTWGIAILVVDDTWTIDAKSKTVCSAHHRAKIHFRSSQTLDWLQKGIPINLKMRFEPPVDAASGPHVNRGSISVAIGDSTSSGADIVTGVLAELKRKGNLVRDRDSLSRFAYQLVQLDGAESHFWVD